MNPMSIGHGIVVAAPILAVAGVLIAIIISNQRTKQAKLDFLRSAMERGAALNPELIDKILRPGAAGRQPLPRGQGALVAGIIVLAFGAGYAIFTYCISRIAPGALFPLMGVTAIFFCIGIGLLFVSMALRSGHADPRE